MKQVLIRLVLGCWLAVWLWLGGSVAMAASAPAREAIDVCAVPEAAIDLNNANLLAFTDCPGFYPNLASAILIHGPYQTVEDVLAIPDLTPPQKALLGANLQFFTVSDPAVPLEQRMPPRITQPSH